MVYSSQGVAKADLFVPATAEEEKKAREDVRKYREAVAKLQQLEATQTLLHQREQELGKRDQELGKRDQELGKRDQELGKREKMHDQEISETDHRMSLRDKEIKALEAQLASLQMHGQNGTAAPHKGGTPVASQSASAAQSTSIDPMPTKGPKFVALNAIARMVLFNQEIPTDRVSEIDRQQAREQVWPFMMRNDPKSGPITLLREKFCAKLTPEGISAIVIPCITQLNLKKCDFGGFKNEIALKYLLTAVKDLQVKHLNFGGNVSDPEVNGQSTCFTDSDLVLLATEIQKLSQNGRRLTITFDDATQNKRFIDLVANGNRPTPAKALPAVPPRPDRTTPIAVSLPGASTSYNAPPQLVPNRGSPPKGQA